MRKKIELICSGYVLGKGLSNKPLCFIKTRNVAKVLPDSSKEQCTSTRIKCLLYDVFAGENFFQCRIYIYIYIRVTIFLGFVYRLVFKLALKYAQNIKILKCSLLFSLGIKFVNDFYKKYFDINYKIFRVLVTD